MNPYSIIAVALDPDLMKFAVAVSSGLLGILIGHYLTKDRDARMRKAILDREAELRRRQFRRIVTKWVFRVQRPPGGKPEDPFPVFEEAITEIAAEFALCGSDFVGFDGLDKAIQAAASTNENGVEARGRMNGQSKREVVTAFLEAIREAAKTNAEQDEGGKRGGS